MRRLLERNMPAHKRSPRCLQTGIAITQLDILDIAAAPANLDAARPHQIINRVGLASEFIDHTLSLLMRHREYEENRGGR